MVSTETLLLPKSDTPISLRKALSLTELRLPDNHQPATVLFQHGTRQEQDWDICDTDVCASAQEQPYLRLCASKQKTKTWSQFVRRATLASLVARNNG